MVRFDRGHPASQSLDGVARTRGRGDPRSRTTTFWLVNLVSPDRVVNAFNPCLGSSAGLQKAKHPDITSSQKRNSVTSVESIAPSIKKQKRNVGLHPQFRFRRSLLISDGKVLLRDGTRVQKKKKTSATGCLECKCLTT